MHFVIAVLLNATVLFALAFLFPSVTIKNYTTAICVALVIGLLNATIGFSIRLPLDILTLGLITFFIKVFVSAIMIKLASGLFQGFKVKGWVPAFIIAFCMAIAGTLYRYIY
ncbi:MAG TPA: phage holin family protein [Ginsengibacter sp.]